MKKRVTRIVPVLRAMACGLALVGAVGCALLSGKDYAEKLPINCVTWFEAFAFCIWMGDDYQHS